MINNQYFKKAENNSSETDIVQTESRKELSEHEQMVKEKLESWIVDVQKKVELDQRLKEAFESDKSHTKSLSQM